MGYIQGIDSSGKTHTIRCDASGILLTGITLSGDIQLGAVELKDATTNSRATIVSGGQQVFLSDANGVILDDVATEAKQDLLLAELQLKADLTETQPVSMATFPLPTGASTSDNQTLVIAQLTSAVTKLNSILTTQTDGSQKVQNVDASGNTIDSHQDADGGWHLGNSLIQSIITSTNNSTTDNLLAGATFIGTADETFGVNGIQLFHAADQDCTIYIDQSIDNTFADSTQIITDSFICLANKPCSRTYISVSPYYRLRVNNNGSNTTTKLASFTGMTPIINPLPRSLSDDGRLLSETTITGQQNTERCLWITPTNALLSESPVRLIGTNFDGANKNVYFWQETVTGTGSVTKGGEIQLNTGATANSTAKYNTIDIARFVVGAALRQQFLAKFVTAGTADNIRRGGVYTATDGFFFQLNASTFQIGTRRASSDTLVSTGSFNGNYGPNFTPLTTQYYKLDIEWTPKAVFFYVDNKLLHKLGAGHYSNLLSLPMAFENNNSNGQTTDVAFDILAAATSRLGNYQTQAKTVPLTANGTYILKYGPGLLQAIVNTDNAGTVNVYDNTSAAAPYLTSPIDATKALGDLSFNANFNTGLTVVVAGGAKVTVVYE